MRIMKGSFQQVERRFRASSLPHFKDRSHQCPRIDRFAQEAAVRDPALRQTIHGLQVSGEQDGRYILAVPPADLLQQVEAGQRAIEVIVGYQDIAWSQVRQQAFR
ncbi:MAG: hypothetical protein JSR95_08445, partial [Proteobacteria bacterium]|nr:hypothetical protein [Pseudomonadota bacterium]